jgi:hypothetical protein
VALPSGQQAEEGRASLIDMMLDLSIHDILLICGSFWKTMIRFRLLVGLLCCSAIAYSQTETKLTASDAAAGDGFGLSVSVRGDTAAIGTLGDSTYSGSVYVFTRDSVGSWIEQVVLTASDAQANDRFGDSVSIDGDTLVVGAWGDDDNGDQSGAAYVFTRDAENGWSELEKLIASDAAAGDFFGCSVSVDGSTAMIGACHDNDGGSDSGSTYVFTRGAGDKWAEHSQLTASDVSLGGLFGASVGRMK